MRLRLALTTILLMLATISFAADQTPREILLDLASDAPGAGIRLIDKGSASLRLQFDLSRLETESVKLGDEIYRRLVLEGASIRGEEGRPALPIFSRMIQVPDGLGVELRIVDLETREFDIGRIMPTLPREGEDPVVDAAYYKRDLSHLQPDAAVGKPGIMRDLRVSPLEIRPVQYDPASGRLTVATRMIVDVAFTPDGEGADTPAPKRVDTITESFDTFYRANVINYADADKSAETEPGTYMMICRDNATVLSHVEPLLDWRRRQGYNVILATTTETGTTNTSIKSYIESTYTSVKPTLEFVTLVGDVSGSYSIPTFQENQSGYGGRGDHNYTMVDGADILPDIHLGRLSFTDDDTDNLDDIVTKIVNYETNPPTGTDPDWFTRGSLVGDPGTSGITTIFVNQWARDQLLAHNYTEIDSLWSPNSSSMYSNFNKGATLMTYRGWLGMSGMQSTTIYNLSNTGELGFAVVMTCDTGSIEDGMCRSEAFLRAPNGGGVASIGTATIGTHTRYNNCMFTGVIEGAWNTGDYRVGPALTNGKLAMYNNYYLAEPGRTETWMVWNSLMGDAATEIWTGLPGTFSVAYDATMDDGANSVFVEVTDSGSGLPVVGTNVTLYKEGEIRFTAVTDDLGRVNIPVSGYSNGDLLITAAKHNYIPHQGTIVIGPATDLVNLSNFVIDDTNWGNSDGRLNPGEHVEIGIELNNLGSVTATAVVSAISSHEPWVTIDAASVNHGNIAPGAYDWGNTMFEITLSSDAPAEHFLQIDVTVTSGAETWHSLMEIEIYGGGFTHINEAFSGPGGDLDPGESGSLVLHIRNTGNADISGATATLTTGSPWISVTDADGTYGAMSINDVADNGGDAFSIDVGSDCFEGHLATFAAIIETVEGARDTIEFQMPVGTASSTDPVGPDAYGYHCFDNTDTGYAFAPTYDWIEIDPTLGGSGTDLGLTDTGWEGDDVTTVMLPFNFMYYGEVYDRISVCSNGWLAMGTTSLKNYRNWHLPTPGSPGAMICGFWDNLYDDGAGGVFMWNDTANDRVIVEWSRMRNDSGGGNETFEIILYDPNEHPSDTGDGIIEMMYNAVAQVDGTNGYSTVGIQNHDRTDGLLYTYWNQYPAAAAALTTGRALRFQTFASVPTGRLEGTVTNASGGGTPAEGVQVTVQGAGRVFTTASDGTYGGSVPPGTYDVIASHPSFATDTALGEVIVEDATTVTDFSLTDIAGPLFTGTTILTNTFDTVGPYTVTTTVTDYTGLGAVQFYYLTAAGGLVGAVATDLGGGDYQGTIPGQPLGTRVRYYFTATDILAYFSSDPAGVPETSYAFWVDDSYYYASDMETSDGWTAGAAGDDAYAGIWTREDPVGVWESATPVQPEDDHTPPSGTICWITGNSESGTQGADDVDGGTTTLLSPVFDVLGYSDLTFSYWRWFTNDTGNNPGEDEWVVQVTDGSGWTDIERTTTSNRAWLQITYALTDFVSATSTVQFRFVASDAGGGSVVEAGIDDFILYNDLIPADTIDPLVDLTAPVPGANYNGGPLSTIEWTDSDNVGVTNTFIYYSPDAGVTWPTLLGEGGLTSPYSPIWDDATNSTDALIKIVCFDDALNVNYDVMGGTFTLDVETGVNVDDLPSRVALTQNHPNPFNPATEIIFALPVKQPITLKVYDVAGREVATLAHGVLGAGTHTIMWRGEDDQGARVSSGLYFYRLSTDTGDQTRKMMLLK